MARVEPKQAACTLISPARGPARVQRARQEGRQPRLLGYCVAGQGKTAYALSAQQGAILASMKKEGAKMDEPEWFVDLMTDSILELRSRPAGSQLLAQAKSGDTIIVSEICNLVRDLDDFKNTIKILHNLEASLWICRYGLVDFASDEVKILVAVMSLFDELREARRRGAGFLAWQKRREAGLASSAHAPYGFKHKFVLRDGQKVKVRVVDKNERKLMKQLLQWSDDGLTLDQILDELHHGDWGFEEPGFPNYSKITGQATGKPWTKNRVVKLIQAERRLQTRDLAGSALKHEKE